MKQIMLSNGMFALVDDEHFEELNKHSWSAKKGRRTYYAVRKRRDGARVWMHREVMRLAGNSCGIENDHRDGNGLNNQSHNIRPATHSQNQQNQRRRMDNTSGFKGVSFHKGTRRWQARIRRGGSQDTIGYFDTPEAASRAYEAAAKETCGEFARAS